MNLLIGVFFWILAFISKSLFDEYQKYSFCRFNCSLQFFCIDSLARVVQFRVFLFSLVGAVIDDGVVVVVFFGEV